ncbi:MAG TPA: TonB-dependent receptor [Woeseiaceae bacterium]|nr:TonB-dependent receptor [Woeseiaceae bacterium]
MNANNNLFVRELSLFLAVCLMTPTTVVWAQQGADETVEEIVATGTRREGQSPTKSLSPIDILAGAALENQAAFDLTDGITRIAPSLNTQRFPIADGTSFIRPVTLRNLSPDQTLVLVDGSRRHRSPLVNLQLSPLGTVNTGSQAVDFAAIPAAAIKRIEILRDGASAQYGSDAIAGVVNIILKDADEGVSLSAQTGEYYEGDGKRTTLSANGGFSLGGRGFFNGTVEYSTSDTTSRGHPRLDCPPIIAAVGPGIVPLDGFCQRWGDPDVETMKVFVNAGFDINDNVEIFGNASYSDNDTISDFFYRTPVLDPSAMIAGRGTLIVDQNGDFIPDDAPLSLVNDIVAAGLNPDDYITPDAGSPSQYVLLNPIASQFPGGYNPNFGAKIGDMALVAGVRGGTPGGLSWDIRARAAESEAEYTLSESINPSLGRLSPTSFRPGKLTQQETEFNADFVRTFDVADLASPLNVAFGVELRNETYKIAQGDPASIEPGPTAAFFGVGSDGFQGFPPDSAGSFDSDSFAFYADLEADITDRFSGGAAVRYEDYDRFGTTFDWKLSGRVQVTDALALRGTVNTGFRAPTPGQVNTLNVTTSVDASGNLIPNGTYPVNNPVAVALGAVPLQPEDSTAFTVGAAFEPLENTSITLDYYQITIDDRLALQSNTIGPAEVVVLTAAGVPNANLLLGSNANFFVNGFESEITGVDLAITSDFGVPGGNLAVDFRHNYNQQDVSKVAPGTINASQIFDIRNQVPEHRSTLSFDYQTGGLFSGYVRLSRYGDWASTGGQLGPPDASDAASYDSEILVDIEATLSFNERYRLTVGGENVLDTFPNDEANGVAQFLGVTYALTSPFGFDGGFWYVRLAADF